MKKNTLSWLVILSIIVIAIFAYRASIKEPDEDYSEFSQCLTDNNAVMYGTYWCSHCKEQKADFGDAFEFIEYIECSTDTDICTEKGIKKFPTWIIDGVSYRGKQTLSRLGEVTGCELPEE